MKKKGSRGFHRLNLSREKKGRLVVPTTDIELSCKNLMLVIKFIVIVRVRRVLRHSTIVDRPSRMGRLGSENHGRCQSSQIRW